VPPAVDAVLDMTQSHDRFLEVTQLAEPTARAAEARAVLK
jgi:hypothetical protein